MPKTGSMPATLYLRLATGEEIEATDEHLAAMGYTKSPSGRAEAIATLLADPNLTKADLEALVADPRLIGFITKLIGNPAAEVTKNLASLFPLLRDFATSKGKSPWGGTCDQPRAND